MPILLYRVDERLVHGQVVIGWGSELLPHRYVVVDDDLAVSEWEQELYQLSVNPDTAVDFATVEEARGLLDAWRDGSPRTVLLTRDLTTMLRLARGGALRGESVNLGGIHHREGRTRVRPYLYLDQEDRQSIRALEDEGVTVTARDLPGSARVGRDALLEED